MCVLIRFCVAILVVVVDHSCKYIVVTDIGVN